MTNVVRLSVSRAKAAERAQHIPRKRFGTPTDLELGRRRLDERHAGALESDGQELAWIVVDEDHGVFANPGCGSGTAPLER